MLKLLKAWFLGEKGAIQTGALYVAIAIIFAGVGYQFFTSVIDGAVAILGWTATDNTSLTYGNIREFTALGAVAGYTPMLVLLGYTVAVAFNGFLAFKEFKGSRNGGLDYGSILWMGVSQIFVGLALNMFPTIMDSMATLINAIAASGYTTYFGMMSTVCRLVPVLIILGLVAVTIVGEYFPAKKMLNDN